MNKKLSIFEPDGKVIYGLEHILNVNFKQKTHNI